MKIEDYPDQFKNTRTKLNLAKNISTKHVFPTFMSFYIYQLIY